MTLLVGDGGASVRFLVLDATIGLVYIGSGFIAWLRHQRSSTVSLLMVCSMLNFVRSYSQPATPTLS